MNKLREEMLLDEEGCLIGHATGAFMILPRDITASNEVLG